MNLQSRIRRSERKNLKIIRKSWQELSQHHSNKYLIPVEIKQKTDEMYKIIGSTLDFFVSSLRKPKNKENLIRRVPKPNQILSMNKKNKSGQLKLNDPPFGQNLAENKGGVVQMREVPILDLASENPIWSPLLRHMRWPPPAFSRRSQIIIPKFGLPKTRGGGRSVLIVLIACKLLTHPKF